MPKIKESALYPAVKAWLEAQGYAVHMELFDADVIGIKAGAGLNDGEIVVVELKAFLSQGLMRQCEHRSWWADFVYAAVPTKGKAPYRFKSTGIGLLRVSGKNHEKVSVQLKAREQPFIFMKSKKYRLKKLLARSPAMAHEVAGLPSTPALRTQRDLRDVRVLECGRPDFLKPVSKGE